MQARNPRRVGQLAALVWIACCIAPTFAQDPGPGDPLDLGTEEEATVRLVLVDVVVLDGEDRTVPDLTADEFEVFAWGEPVAIDTVDVDCPIGIADEPTAKRRASLAAPEAGRRIVLAFDYLHLNQIVREESLDAAMRLVREGGSGDDEIMVVALNGGVRVEQTFTRDTDQVLRSLRRMRYDISLWNGNFAHINEHGFVNGMTGMFDVLGTVPGPKAVVLYSGMQDVPLDSEFDRLAAVASASRCSIYPVDPAGLFTPGIDRRQQPGAG